MVLQVDRLPQDRHLSRRGSVGAALVLAAALVLVVVPVFALAAKATAAGRLSAEARTVIEASATGAFPSLALARLGAGITDADMAAFRETLEASVLENAATGPLAGCVLGVEAVLESEGTVACTLVYRPGDLGKGVFGDAVPAAARATCRVDLPVEP